MFLTHQHYINMSIFSDEFSDALMETIFSIHEWGDNKRTFCSL